MVGIYARGLHDEEMFVVQWEKIVTRGWKLMTRDGLSDALIRCSFFSSGGSFFIGLFANFFYISERN